MRFEFATATRILFGPGTRKELGVAAREMGHHALIVTGRHTERAESLLADLRATNTTGTLFPRDGEPTLDQVRQGVQQARQEGCDLVVGLGGGSALDAAKAIAALLANGGDPLDYVEVIGQGRALTRPSTPVIAIPTTAGTGTEVTRNAVLSSIGHQVKVSMRSPFMLASLAIIDPELTYSLPPRITADTGLDALTQLIEPFVSSRANPMTDALCREGMARVARSLERAWENGNDANAREDMSLASLFSGLALANAGLGAVHGIAGPLGGMFGSAPHGAVCAALLPRVMSVNVEALRQRQPRHPALQRYEEVARILTGRPTAAIEAGIEWVDHVGQRLQIARLGAFGVSQAAFAALITKATAASSMRSNPIPLEAAELEMILARSL